MNIASFRITSHKWTEMINSSTAIVPIAAIALDDEKYRIDDGLNVSAGPLRTFMERAGCVHPAVVHASASRYLPVIGRPILLLARELGWETIPVIAIAEDTAAVKVFELAVLDRLAQNRPLNPLETATILHRLLDEMQQSRQVIVQTWLPLLGYGKNPHVLEVYLPFYDLDPRSREELAQDRLSIDFAQLLLKKNVSERQLLLDVVHTLRLGKNRQKEFLLLLEDVSRIEHIDLATLLQQESLRTILQDSQITPSQKADRFKVELWSRRYPVYTNARQRFNEILTQADWPAALHVQPSPFFNSEEISISFSFRSTAEYRALVDELERLHKSGAIEQLVQVS
jgi:ParB family chromosome partitioning protein